MYNYNFKTLQGTQQQTLNAVLNPSAPLAEVAMFNVAALKKLAITFAVTVAPLSNVEIYARSDTNAAWFQITDDDLYGYGRTDNSGDYKHTPAGQSGMVALDVDIWNEVSLRMASAGATRLAITAGVE